MGASFPTTDQGLLAWSLNFSTLISATPTAYGLTAAQATAYDTLHDAYATALAACDPSVRSKTAVITKNTAKANLKTQAQALASLVDGTLTVTDAQKTELGLTVRKMPAPIPRPDIAPEIDILSINGNAVKIRLHNETIGRRGKPNCVYGASVFTYVSPNTPPLDPSVFQFEGNTGKTEMIIIFPSELTPGTKVWITAFWFNPAKESGPGTIPVGVTLNYASSIEPPSMQLAA